MPIEAGQDDILSLLENTSSESLVSENTLDTTASTSITPVGIPAVSSIDILSVVEETLVIEETKTEGTDIYQELLGIHEALKKAGKNTWKNIQEKIIFFWHYILVSCVVFGVLLLITNFSAYSAIFWNYVHPESLQASSREIFRTVDAGNIEVHADASDSHESPEEAKAKEEKIRKELEAENVAVKDAFLSPKKLVPNQANIPLDVEIVPYENRIVIPKLGKNVPLVDVNGRQGLSFENLEDVFMQELEKGVVRYPGTARPGDDGNAFVFGHSSNYPWIKGDYNDVFALLDNLVYGDEIIVYYNQKKYTYVIREKKVVKPGNVKVMNREEGKKELSLMTCWPVGTALNRLIVFSELKSVTDSTTDSVAATGTTAQ